MKIGPGVLELWGVENRRLPLTRPMAYTTACTTVQAVIRLTTDNSCTKFVLYVMTFLNLRHKEHVWMWIFAGSQNFVRWKLCHLLLISAIFREINQVCVVISCDNQCESVLHVVLSKHGTLAIIIQYMLSQECGIWNSSTC